MLFWIFKFSCFICFLQKCIEWKPEIRLSPEQAFSHPFISKAVNDLKCIKEPSSAAHKSGEGDASTPSQNNDKRSSGRKSSD